MGKVKLEDTQKYFYIGAHRYKKIAVKPLINQAKFEDGKDKFLYYYKIMIKKLKHFKSTLKYNDRMSVDYIFKYVKEIVPFKLFGSYRNLNQFRKLIYKLCTSTRYELIYIPKILQNWQLDDIKWLAPGARHKEFIITQVVLFLIKFVRVEILHRLYKIRCDTKSYRIHFIPKNKFRRFHDKTIRKMIKNNQLKPIEKTEGEKIKVPSILMLHPKSDLATYRPLVRTKIFDAIPRKTISNSLKNKGFQYTRSLYTAFSDFIKNVDFGQPIYGVKIDLQDAFSNANVETRIVPFVKKFLKNYPEYKNLIINGIRNPTVKDGNKYYIWNRGLMQGAKFSPMLCDLERAFFDKIYIQPHVSEKTFFHRTMDDYFFCSPDREEVIRVKTALEENCIISEHKTQTNIDNEKLEIDYCGYTFNLHTREVHIKIRDVPTLRYYGKTYYSKTAEDDPESFILKEVGSLASNCFNFSKLLINCSFNSPETTLANYFKAMIIIAFKVDCAVSERYEDNNLPASIADSVLKLIQLHTKRVRKYLISTKIRKVFSPACSCMDCKRISGYKNPNMKSWKNIPEKPIKISTGLLNTIGIRSFILVLKKRPEVYKSTIKVLQDHIKSYRHPYLNKSFCKLPKEFAQYRVKRYSKEYD